VQRFVGNRFRFRRCHGVDYRSVDCRCMPGRYAIANWKMNVPPEGIDTYLRALASHRNGRASLVVAPPFLYLKDVVSHAPANVAVGGQSCDGKTGGAHARG